MNQERAGRIPVTAIPALRFEKTEVDLLAYDYPITKVIEDNSVKDMAEAVDRKFLFSMGVKTPRPPRLPTRAPASASARRKWAFIFQASGTIGLEKAIEKWRLMGAARGMDKPAEAKLMGQAMFEGYREQFVKLVRRA